MVVVLSDDGGDDTPPPGGGENSFVYEGAESKIGSVVYQVDETGKTYTFYFSPTEGLLDLDAMLLADDYIKIETDTPTGDIDLLAEGNSLLYKKVDISAASADNTAKSTLSLQLTSLTTVKMTLDAAMKSGETLTASYNGTCSRHSEQSGQGEGIVLDTPVFSWWLGSEKPASGANDYYIAVTDAPYTIQSGVQAALTEPGYMLVIDCYLDSGEKWKTFPHGRLQRKPRAGGPHLFVRQQLRALLRRNELQPDAPLGPDHDLARRAEHRQDLHDVPRRGRHRRRSGHGVSGSRSRATCAWATARRCPPCRT